MSQENYNDWVMTTSAYQQDRLCGGNQISLNEKYFIDNYAKNNIIDIGCGTGNRTFPEWIKRNLKFFGIEKFKNLIDASILSEQIKHCDIVEESFQDTFQEILINLNNRIDIAILFGGVVNGVIDQEKHQRMWDNFKFISEKCDFILIDTLTHFNWFNTQDSGNVEKLFHVVPLQYFYSKKEIDRLNDVNNLEIFEQKSENIGELKRTHYLLRKKANFNVMLQ